MGGVSTSSGVGTVGAGFTAQYWSHFDIYSLPMISCPSGPTLCMSKAMLIGVILATTQLGSVLPMVLVIVLGWFCLLAILVLR